RLEERALGLGGRAVDLVGQEEIGEDGPLARLKLAAARIVEEMPRHVARHQVGRELHAREGRGDRAGEGQHEERLADAGHALEQHVAAGEEADEHLLEHLVLPEHDAAERAPERVDEREEFFGGSFVHGDFRSSSKAFTKSTKARGWPRGERTSARSSVSRSSVTCSLSAATSASPESPASSGRRRTKRARTSARAEATSASSPPRRRTK